MIKVLYCHGMGGSGFNSEPRILSFLNSKDIDLISPTINHDLYVGNSKLFEMLIELAADVDLIVGNSMGGYFAYHLGKATGKPTLCFNPAISEITTSYNWFHATTNYEDAEIAPETRIFLSENDTVVDHDETVNYLHSRGNLNNTEMRTLHNLDHSLPLPLIFKEMFQFCFDLDLEVKPFDLSIFDPTTETEDEETV